MIREFRHLLQEILPKGFTTPVSEHEVLDALPARFSSRDRLILIERYGLFGTESTTFSRLGAKYGLSGSAVESRVQLMEQGLRRLWAAADSIRLLDRSAPITPDTPIVQLKLSARAFNCLERENIVYLRDLERYSQHDLLRIRHFGKKCLAEVLRFARAAGMKIEPYYTGR